MNSFGVDDARRTGGDRVSPSATHLVLDRIGSAAKAIEKALITAFAWTLSLIVPSICLIGLIDLSSRTKHGQPPGSRSEWVSVVAVLVGASILGWMCVVATGHAFRRGSTPFAPSAALDQWRFPPVLRVVPCVWWLGHFLLGAAFAIGIERSGGQLSLAAHVLVFAITLILLASANLYLLLAIGALGRFSGLIHAVWRLRFLIDLVAATLSMLL